ncbi:aspartate aminotransferase family protein (plasmid) [Glycocaulis abyssi]|uniref:Aspartate aminotransferase family protein n=1 Tax=Glycocaulis abyssi TaxID=1433403 RepID=A0ABV9NCN5_9PROT
MTLGTRDLPAHGIDSAGWFPGPRAEHAAWLRDALARSLDTWSAWRRDAGAGDPSVWPDGQLPDDQHEQIDAALQTLARRLSGETATFSPHYAGHMVSDASMPALLGHVLATLHNPNNTSKEVSRVGTQIEAEAIAMLARMIGFDPAHARGHMTSCGTIANFEAVWRARFRLDHWLSLALWLAETQGERLDVFAAAHMGWPRYHTLRERHAPPEDALRAASAVAGNPADTFRRISRASGREYLGPVVMVPENKHFSWRKAANVFGLGEEAFRGVGLDAQGRLCLKALEHEVEKATAQGRPVLAAVSVAGATETGNFDPVDGVCDLMERWRRERGWRIWHHVDAAYGGFFASTLGAGATALSDVAASALAAIRRVDSITIDPHKLGYTPYACGAFLVRDAQRYAVSSFAAPYLERAHVSDDLWSATLEGSRTSAGAAAVWMTGTTIGFTPDGFGRILENAVEARRAIMHAAMKACPDLRLLDPCDTNIACFTVARTGEPLSVVNAGSEALYEASVQGGRFTLSKTHFPLSSHAGQITRHVEQWGGDFDADGLTVLRCVFMNPYLERETMRAHVVEDMVTLLSGAAPC